MRFRALRWSGRQDSEFDQAGKVGLAYNAVTCGEPACKRSREANRLREKYGPGTAYAEAHRLRHLGNGR